MFSEAQAQGGAQPQSESESAAQQPKNDGVVEAEFEEVKDEK